jgi:hypothetical protein
MVFIKQNENVKFSFYPTFFLPDREKFLVTVTCFTFTFHSLRNLLLFIYIFSHVCCFVSTIFFFVLPLNIEVIFFKTVLDLNLN